METVAQVVVEPLHFSFGLGAVGLADFQCDAAVLFGEVPELRVELVLAVPVGVALDDDGLHVVVEAFARHAAEVAERIHVAGNECVDLLVVHVLDV